MEENPIGQGTDFNPAEEAQSSSSGFSLGGGFAQIISAIIGAITDIYTQKKDLQSQKDLQEDSQSFNAQEAQKARDYQEMVRQDTLPDRMMQRYQGMGASHSAALQAAMGIQPSMPSGASASSGIASVPAHGNPMADVFNALGNSINSFFDNKLKSEEIKNMEIKNTWDPIFNQLNVRNVLHNMDMDLKRFGLDERQYQLSVRMTNSIIGKNSVEIERIKAETKNLEEEFYNIRQQFKLLQAQTKKTEREADTELVRQENIEADTDVKRSEKKLIDEQTIGQRYTNWVLKANAFYAKNFHFDPHWNVSSLGYHVRTSEMMNDLKDRVKFNLGSLSGKKGSSIERTLQTTEKTLDLSLDSINSKRQAVQLFEEWNDSEGKRRFPEFNNSYNRWIKSRGLRLQRIADWIDRNTQYGH